MDDILDRACSAVGGLAKLAAAIGQSPQAVANWRMRGVPLLHCAAIEQATAGAVTRRELRPHDWHLIWPELMAAAPKAEEVRDAA